MLGAGQILSILEENPEAVVEVKSMVADGLRQKGVAVQADAISDEQLYTQIVSNSELRANLSYFLRARGYVAGEDLRGGANAGLDASQARRGSSLQDEFMIGAPDFGSVLPGGGSNQELNALALPSGQSQSASAERTRTNGREPATTEKNSRNVTDEPDVLRRPAPYNLRSLRDLYTQVPDSAEHLRRFGSEVFRNRGTEVEDSSRFSFARGATPLDVPLGPDYVLGPGDELSINLWVASRRRSRAPSIPKAASCCRNRAKCRWPD